MSLADLFNKDSTAGTSANCKPNYRTKKDLSNTSNFNEEYSVIISDIMHDEDLIACSNNGVELHNIPNMLKLTYEGILAKSGAQEIYAVIGYGDNQNWEDVGTHKMQKTAKQTFELTAFRKKPGNVHIAFKDSVGNWDNNSGNNYIFYDTSEEGGK